MEYRYIEKREMKNGIIPKPARTYWDWNCWNYTTIQTTRWQHSTSGRRPGLYKPSSSPSSLSLGCWHHAVRISLEQVVDSRLLKKAILFLYLILYTAYCSRISGSLSTTNCSRISGLLSAAYCSRISGLLLSLKLTVFNLFHSCVFSSECPTLR